MERKIFITELDMGRLRPLVDTKQSGRDDLLKLRSELDRAHIVAPREVPPDVVTMNSKVKMRDLDTGEEEIYTLVFPDKANIDEGKISVIAPIGTAMLGYRVGDEVQWEVPAGKVRFKIEEVLYQPEAAGHFHL